MEKSSYLACVVEVKSNSNQWAVKWDICETETINVIWLIFIHFYAHKINTLNDTIKQNCIWIVESKLYMIHIPFETYKQCEENWFQPNQIQITICRIDPKLQWIRRPLATSPSHDKETVWRTTIKLLNWTIHQDVFTYPASLGCESQYECRDSWIQIYDIFLKDKLLSS